MCIENTELTVGEVLEAVRYQHQRMLRRFGLEVTEVSVKMVGKTDSLLQLEVTELSDSVMDRGNITIRSFKTQVKLPIYSGDHITLG